MAEINETEKLNNETEPVPETSEEKTSEEKTSEEKTSEVKTPEEKTPVKKKRRKKLHIQIALITVIPIIIMGVLFVFIGMYSLHKNAVYEMFNCLKGNCILIADHFSSFKGGFHMDNGELYCGDKPMGEEYYYLENIKKAYGSEISIFFGNNRVMTTLTDETGDPLLGTMLADSRIVSNVFRGNIYSTEKNTIRGERYLCVYVPLYNKVQVVGMVGSAISLKSFYRANLDMNIVIVLLTLLTAVVTFIMIGVLSKKIVRRLTKISDYMEELVTYQTADQDMDDSVFRRNDEIAELGEHSLRAGQSIKMLMGTDPLTTLYNRRAARQRLKEMWEVSHKDFTVFTIVIGDLDHFKKINDEYGHDMGDTVLAGISAILKKHAVDNGGFASRWGGEEFLLGFDLARDETCDIIKELSKDIKRQAFFTKNHKAVHMSMTFGVASFTGQENIDAVINQADENLYKGKNQGRDCIVS